MWKLMLACLVIGYAGQKLWTAYKEEYCLDDVDEHESMLDELSTMENTNND